MGRVARQSEEGSYSQIIHADYLQTVNIGSVEALKDKSEGNMDGLFDKVMNQLDKNQNRSQLDNNLNVDQAN